MSDNIIAERIIAFFTERGKEIPSADYDIFENQLIDSMELMELLMFLEKELGIEVDQELMTVDNFRTFDAILSTIRAGQG